MGALTTLGLVAAAPNGSKEEDSLFPGTLRTGTWRTVIAFDLGPGGAYASCLNALNHAGLDSDRRALIMAPGRFKIVRPEGDIDPWHNTGETRKFELRQYF